MISASQLVGADAGNNRIERRGNARALVVSRNHDAVFRTLRTLPHFLTALFVPDFGEDSGHDNPARPIWTQQDRRNDAFSANLLKQKAQFSQVSLIFDVFPGQNPFIL